MHIFLIGSLKILYTAFEITFENGLSANVISIGNLLAERELVLELRLVNCANKCFAQMQFIYSKIDFQQLVNQIQHSPTFCVLVGRTTGNKKLW